MLLRLLKSFSIENAASKCVALVSLCRGQKIVTCISDYISSMSHSRMSEQKVVCQAKVTHVLSDNNRAVVCQILREQ